MKFTEYLALVCTTILVSGCHSFRDSEAAVSLKNISSSDIQVGEINLADESRKFSRVKIGETLRTTFSIKHDSSYEISITLVNGQKLTAKAGYLTNGISQVDTLKVMDDKIILISSASANPEEVKWMIQQTHSSEK